MQTVVRTAGGHTRRPRVAKGSLEERESRMPAQLLQTGERGEAPWLQCVYVGDPGIAGLSVV